MRRANIVLWLLIILAGSVFGNIIGGALSEYIPILNYGQSIRLGPLDLDLSILKITFGFNASLTVASIIGILIAILIFKKVK